MSELSHEKYISIEYDVWERKYKPMEKTLEYYKELLAEREINITINRDWMYSARSKERVVTINISVEGGVFRNWFDKPEFKRSLQEAVNREFDGIAREIAEANRKIAQLPRFVRYLFGLEYIKPVKLNNDE